MAPSCWQAVNVLAAEYNTFVVVSHIRRKCNYSDGSHTYQLPISFLPSFLPSLLPSLPTPILTSTYILKSTPTIKKSSDGLVVLRRLCNQMSCKHKHLTVTILTLLMVRWIIPLSKEIVGSNPTRCNSSFFALA